MPATATVPAHRRHDISDRAWEILEPFLPGGRGKTGTGPPGITASSSTPYAGFGAPARLGATRPRTTGTGRTPTVASAAGGTEGCGLGCWRPGPMSPIPSG